MNNYDFKDTKKIDIFSISFKNNVLENILEKIPGTSVNRISHRTIDRNVREKYYNEDVLTTK